MTQSPEYPDLPWVPPLWWQRAGRTSVQFIVIHATDGSEGRTSAEDGAAYDARRSEKVSTHYFHDSDSTVQCVRTEDIAWAAYPHGNHLGIQHELCGLASQTAAQWEDPASLGTLHQAARQVARDCLKWGIPVRHITPSQMAAGVKGIGGHWDVTRAFPADGGDHTDPGPNFPWDLFLRMVQDATNGASDMTPEQTQQAVYDGALALLFDGYHAAAQDATYKAATPARQQAMRNVRDTLRGIVGGPTDPAAVAAQVIALIPPGAQVSEAVLEEALRAVLRTGVGAA